MIGSFCRTLSRNAVRSPVPVPQNDNVSVVAVAVADPVDTSAKVVAAGVMLPRESRRPVWRR